MRVLVLLLSIIFISRSGVADDFSDFYACRSAQESGCVDVGPPRGTTCTMSDSGSFYSGGRLYNAYNCDCDGYSSQLWGSCSISIPDISGPPSQPPEKPQNKCGSIIGVDNRTLRETIPLVGVPFSLHYSTQWAKKRVTEYTINIPITDANPPAGVSSWAISIYINGFYVYGLSISNGPNVGWTYTWDGTNGLGIPYYSSAVAEIRIQADTAATPIYRHYPVGGMRGRLYDVGGWRPSILHFYDPVRKVLSRGDGTTYGVEAITLSGGDLQVPEPDASLVHIFSSSGRHLETKSGLLGTTLFTFNYNGAGQITSIVQPFGRTTTFHRDVSGDLTSIEGPFGDTTSITLSTDKLIESVTNPNNETYELTYAYNTDLLETFEKPNGIVSTFTYNSDGYLSLDEHSGGSQTSLTSTGPPANLTVEAASALGITSEYVTSNYYPAGSYSRIENLASGATRNFSMSTWGLTAFQGGRYTFEYWTSDPRFGSSARYAYSKTVGPRTETQAHAVSLGTTSPFSVTGYTVTTTVNSQNTVRYFDGSTKTFTTTTPEGRVGTEEIDNYERVVESQWASDTPISYTYTNDQLTEIAQGGRSTALAYDGATGLLSSVTNPLSETTSFVYDDARRVTSVILPDTRIIQVSYDAAGNMVGITPPGRSQHGLPLNGHELLGEYQPPAIFPLVVNVGYQYNNDKQLTQITRPDAQTISFSYGSTTGVLQSITTPDGTYNYGFDTYTEKTSSASTPASISNTLSYSEGELSGDTLSDSGGTVAQYTASYNSLFKIGSETIYPASSASHSVAYGYDNDELLISAGDISINRNATSGRIAGTAIGSVTDTWDYNSFGELDEYEFKYSTTTLFDYALVRDDLGRVDTLTETVQGVTTTYEYDYDNSGRLTDVTKNSVSYSHYSFDSNSNRTSGNTGGTSFSAVVDAQDRLTDYNLVDYTYSLAGELETKVNTLTSETTTFVYDVLGNLKSVTLPSSDVVTYEADGFNRRVSRTLNGTVTSKYLYDGSRIVAELDSGNALKYRFVYGTKPHVPDYMTDGTDTWRIVTDHIGSVRLVVKVSDGTVAQKISYNEMGRVLSDTNPGFQPFGFAGGLYDPDTKLVRFGARDYDPETGRWTSKDPILFNGGDMNLYGYVLADPVNLIDPSGNNPLIAAPIIGGLTGAIIGGISAGINGGNIGTGAWSGFVGGATAGLGLATGFGAGAAIFAGTLTNVLTALPDSGADPGDVGNGFRSLLEPKKKQCP